MFKFFSDILGFFFVFDELGVYVFIILILCIEYNNDLGGICIIEVDKLYIRIGIVIEFLFFLRGIIFG